jgi:hypothetical protein
MILLKYYCYLFGMETALPHTAPFIGWLQHPLYMDKVNNTVIK